MASETSIANLALIRVGATKQIANLETERSAEAIAIRTVFDQERDYVLRDFPWPFATAYVELALVDGSSTTPVNYDWQYAYRYPSDCLFVRRIMGPNGRRDPNPPPYRVGRDSQGRLIYTNEADAEIEFTYSVTEPEEFDSMFVSMLAWKIASVIAPSLSRIKGMAETAMQMYEIDKSKAASRSLNEQQQEQPLESEFVRARD